MYVAIAHRFGIDPVAVLEWPERVYEDVVLVLQQESKHEAAEAAKRKGRG